MVSPHELSASLPLNRADFVSVCMADAAIVQKDEIPVIRAPCGDVSRMRDRCIALLPDCAARCSSAKVVGNWNTTGGQS